MGLWSSFVRVLGPQLDSCEEREEDEETPYEESAYVSPTLSRVDIKKAHGLFAQIEQLEGNRFNLANVPDERLEICERIAPDRYNNGGPVHHVLSSKVPMFNLRVALVADIEASIQTIKDELRQLGVKVDA